MSFSSFDEVSTTTGIILSFPLDLISFNTSNPSTFGSFRSSSMTAGLPLERILYSPRQFKESRACSPSRVTTTSLARLYSSRAVEVSSTSLGSSSTIKIRPSLLFVSMVILVVSELKNRKWRLCQRHPQPRPCLRDDVLCAEPWPVQCPCLQIQRLGAGVETRRTAYLHTSYQNPRRCP